MNGLGIGLKWLQTGKCPSATIPQKRRKYLNLNKQRLFRNIDLKHLNKNNLCGRRDSNSHALRRQILSLVRLPISPRPLICF